MSGPSSSGAEQCTESIPLDRRISLDLFAHTLDLDLKFHLMRKTGEVTRIMDRGTNALQNILSTVIFNIGAHTP